MADPIRIKSNLPLALRIAEPHPNPERPGDSPELKQAVLQPGVNEGIDPDLFKAWSEANPGFVADADAVKGGQTDGKVYVLDKDEPEAEYGFEVALKRAAEGDNAKAAKDGSTVTDRTITSEDQRTGTNQAAGVAPVLSGAGGAPVKTPATDGNLAQGKPAEKTTAPAAKV